MFIKSINAIKILLLPITLVFFLSSTCWATTYYLDAKSGSDTNAGTSELSPWRSVSKINSRSFAPGDSILFKRGETWSGMLTPRSSGNSADPIIFGAYGTGERPKLTSSSSDCINIGSQREYITFRDLHLFNCGDDGFEIWHTGVSSSHIIIEDVEISSARRLGLMIGNSDDTILRRLTVHDTETSHGLYIDGATSNGTDRIIVEDSEFFNNHKNGIELNGNNVYRTQNPLIRRNKIYNNGHAGILDLSSINSRIENNIIWGNGSGGIWLHYDNGDDPDGSVSSVYANVYNNAIITVDSGNWGPAFFVGEKSTLGEFKNNIIVHNDRNNAIIYIENTQNAKLDNNCYFPKVATNWVYGQNYSTNFSTYRAYSGQDDHSILGDPLFEDISKDDYRLQPTSPCLDSGADVGILVSIDHVSIPQGTKPDIGPFEFTSTVEPLAPPTNLGVTYP